MLGRHCALVEIEQVLRGEERASGAPGKGCKGGTAPREPVPPAVHGRMGMIMLIYLLWCSIYLLVTMFVFSS
jgi:hypothetical protein